MAFVREELTEKEGEKLRKKHDLINPVTKDPLVPAFWAIDRDEDAYIIATGVEGHGGAPLHINHFILFWNDQKIDLEEYEKDGEEENTWVRYVKTIIAPVELLDNDTKPKLEALVKDGVICIQRNYGSLKYEYVQLTEPQTR